MVALSYKLRLHPSRVKSEMLALLCAHFGREHARAVPRVLAHWWNAGKPSMKGFSTKGEGEFAERAVRRAAQDLARTLKSCRRTGSDVRIPTLRAEMMDNVKAQRPRYARRFQVWFHIEGLSASCQMYLPANLHRAVNRALALPGAKLANSATIFRKNGKWYATVYVHVPFAEPYQPHGFIGADVGVRKSVCTSDGRRGRDLRPVLRRMRDRNADRQRRGCEKITNGFSFQRSLLSGEARRIVSVARKSGRGVAVEDPSRLVRWRMHAARFFGERVKLLCQIAGVPVVLVPPAYTSQTHARCGSRESTVRHGELLWCAACRSLEDADVNAAKQISAMARENIRTRRTQLALRDLSSGGLS